MAVCHTQHHLSLVQVKRCHESDSVFLNNMVSLSLSAQSRGLWVVFFPWKISPDLYLWNENVYIRKGRKSSKRSWAVIHVAGGSCGVFLQWVMSHMTLLHHAALKTRCVMPEPGLAVIREGLQKPAKKTVEMFLKQTRPTSKINTHRNPVGTSATASCCIAT